MSAKKSTTILFQIWTIE